MSGPARPGWLRPAAVPASVADAFALRDATVLGGGHIHASFLASGPAGRVVVQCLNQDVFRDLDALCGNVERMVGHLATRCARPLRLCATASGALHTTDEQSRRWRAFDYLEGTEARETVASAAAAARVAAAFGGFLRLLRDLPAPPLAEVIPGFHDLAGRIDALERAVRADPMGRAPGLGAELAAARAIGAALVDPVRVAVATLDVRPVHNDAKVANVRFAEGGDEVVAVVDLDTVMPGVVLHDIGELVRTLASPAAEDETDLGRVQVDDERVAAAVEGFVAGAGDALSAAERRLLGLGGPWLALENGVRFLTDHLLGDVYFRVQRPGHNLDRARVQLRLAELLAER